MKLASQVLQLSLPFVLLCGPTLAWEFTPGPPCILTHTTARGQMELTYDPTLPLYTITITQPTAWPDTPLFAMRFDGAQGRKIATDKHQMSDEGRALTVSNSAFGNLLDGLEYNRSVSAITGAHELQFSLEGATEPVRKFRACDLPLS